MKKLIKGIFSVFFLFFLLIFFNRNHNYYENSNVIPEEAIQRFENDLKEGKEIIPANYITPKKQYNNRATKVCLVISRGIEFVVDKTLRKFLDYLSH